MTSTPTYDEFCNKVHAVECRCGKVAIGSQEQLEKWGWSLRHNTVTCPPCTMADVQFEAGITIGRCRKLIEQIDRETLGLKSAVDVGHIEVPF